jgi:hypothetical protein
MKTKSTCFINGFLRTVNTLLKIIWRRSKKYYGVICKFTLQNLLKMKCNYYSTNICYLF